MTASAEWRQAWYANKDVVYLNAAGQTPMPRVSLEAVQATLEWKKFPHAMAEAAAGARGWDASETASYFNLAGWDASLRSLKEVGVATVAAHNRELMAQLFESLPRNLCVRTSPIEAQHPGPFGCFAAHTPEQSKEFYERLRKSKVFASLREGNIRVSAHLYNTEQDIDKLVEVIAR